MNDTVQAGEASRSFSVPGPIRSLGAVFDLDENALERCNERTDNLR